MDYHARLAALAYPAGTSRALSTAANESQAQGSGASPSNDISVWLRSELPFGPGHAEPANDLLNPPPLPSHDEGAAPSEFSSAFFYPTLKDEQDDSDSQTNFRRTASSGGKRASGEDSDGDDPANEEKRRRNSAASARFRLKKKLKEQSLEQTAKMLTEKADILQRRVRVLEAEVAYLRELIVLRQDRDREAELAAAADHARSLNELLASEEP